MTSSSAHPTYSITLNDEIITHTDSVSTVSFVNGTGTGFIAQEIGTILPDTITITGNGSAGYTTMSSDTITLDLSGINGSTHTIGGASFTWATPEEWVDCFPQYDKVKEMCEKYPAFKIAFEKFKQMYDLVEDDYEAKKGNKYVP